MFYTVGHKDTYDKNIAREEAEGRKLRKQGRTDSYLGGSVFITHEEAIAFLDKGGLLETYHVYGLDTTSDNIYRNLDYDHFHLIEACDIVKLEDPNPA